jgi:hypothetical protein
LDSDGKEHFFPAVSYPSSVKKEEGKKKKCPIEKSSYSAVHHVGKIQKMVKR